MATDRHPMRCDGKTVGEAIDHRFHSRLVHRYIPPSIQTGSTTDLRAHLQNPFLVEDIAMPRKKNNHRRINQSRLKKGDKPVLLERSTADGDRSSPNEVGWEDSGRRNRPPISPKAGAQIYSLPSIQTGSTTDPRALLQNPFLVEEIAMPRKKKNPRRINQSCLKRATNLYCWR
ncbi:hypothetical protein CDAR_83111 [Caerostris darwini]|uniref:Uncharacterized protein n=1 Tax=Caerostris darwini TaxID=1538125 RepID=A0AAV4NXT1_9ARAC|nr:hypothetical protein CDAR_83111 [Caerostris darwini]